MFGRAVGLLFRMVVAHFWLKAEPSLHKDGLDVEAEAGAEASVVLDLIPEMATYGI